MTRFLGARVRVGDLAVVLDATVNLHWDVFSGILIAYLHSSYKVQRSLNLSLI